MSTVLMILALVLAVAVVLMVAIAVADRDRDRVVVDQVAPRGRHHWNDDTREIVPDDWMPHIGKKAIARDTDTQPITWPLNSNESEATR